MKVETKGNKTIVTLTYEEWIKNPYPQVAPLLIDHSTQYVVTNVPPDKEEEFKGFMRTFNN